MKKDIENKLLAVVRIRGRVGTRRDINETLSRLGLKSPNNLVVVYGTKSILGMISKCNDFVTYGEVDRKGFELIAKKAKATVDEETLKSVFEGKRAQIGLTWLKRAGLIEITEGIARLTQKSPSHFHSEDWDLLRRIANGDTDYSAGPEALGNLLKRGLVRQHAESRITKVSITEQGMKASLVSDDSIGQLTRSIISSGAWEGRNFKPYEINAPVEPSRAARRHPLRETISEIKKAYLSMGFYEVSGPMVEPAFWVFDSLFVPQDHPARDVQDTFYLSNPEHLDYEQEYEKTVRRAHKGSWKSGWDKRIAESAMLRTHTTSVSSRYIYRIIKEIRKNPGSYNQPNSIKKLRPVRRDLYRNLVLRNLRSLEAEF